MRSEQCCMGAGDGSGRPSWSAYHMRIAEAVGDRASCPRLAVGAVIVDDRHQIIATGYNGAPMGSPSCLDNGCIISEYSHDGREHCVRAIHAEMNALLTALRRGVSVDGATIYVTHKPCEFCARALDQAGVRSIVYGQEYGR